MLCGASAAAAVGNASGDDTKAVHGPDAPVVEYAMLAFDGPAAVRHRAVALSASPVKAVVSAQKAMPSLAVDGGAKVPPAKAFDVANPNRAAAELMYE